MPAIILFYNVLMSSMRSNSTDTKDELSTEAQDFLEQASRHNEFSRALIRSNPQQSLFHAREALKYADLAGDMQERARSLWNVGACELSFANYDTSLEALDEALLLYTELQHQAGIANVLYEKGIVYAHRGDNRVAIDVCMQSLLLWEQIGDFREILKMLNALGVLYGEIGNYPKALDYFLRGLSIGNKEGYLDALGSTCNNTGNLYFWMRDFDQALKYYQQGLEYRSRMGDKVGEAQSLGNISGIYLERGQRKEALERLRQASHMFQALGNRYMYGQTLNNIGFVYQREGDLHTALAYYYRTLQIYEALKKTAQYGVVLKDIGNVYCMLGNYQEGVGFLTDALEYIQKTGDLKTEFEAHGLLSSAYEALHDLPKAIAHLKSFAAVREQVESAETQKTMTVMQLRFDVEKAEAEKELAQKEAEIARHESEIFKLQNKQLEMQMELKNKELTTLALYLSQKNEVLVRLKKKMRQLERGEESSRSVVREAMHQIDESIGAEENWGRFEQQFQQVHHSFLRKLSELHPSLSPTELKVCSLIKINLSTKEMAQMLCQSTRSIESYRYRIRKKIDLEQETNLTLYLMSF